MLILFDNGTPAPLRYALKGHVVVEARLVNGELKTVSEAAGFELLLTTGKNIRNQQNLTGRKIAFVVLGNQQWPTCADTLKGSSPP
jgi:fructose-specific component phosphotransferase system IIB-like protein